MKCVYCDFETESLNSDDAETEMERHCSIEHKIEEAPLGITIGLLALQLQYNLTAEETIEKFFTIREKFGIRYSKDMIKN